MKRAPSPLLIALMSAFVLTGAGAHAQTTASGGDAAAATALPVAVAPAQTSGASSFRHQKPHQTDLTTLIAVAGLAKENVTTPTADQVSAAVANVQFLRASGMGWNAIANTLGVQLESVISQARGERESRDRRTVEAKEIRREHDDDEALSAKKDKASLLAMASLAKQNVTNPTPEQVSASLAKVQTLRDSGMGWGAIANSLGLRLGAVVSASNAENRRAERLAKQGGTASTTQRSGMAEDDDRPLRERRVELGAMASSLWARIGSALEGSRLEEGRKDGLSKKASAIKDERRAGLASSSKQKDFPSLIARASLAKQNVTDPTADQLSAAVTDVQSKRDSGMGWGAIANSLGVRLGDVVSASRSRGESAERRTEVANERKDERRAQPSTTSLVAATSSVSVSRRDARNEDRGESQSRSDSKGGSSDGSSGQGSTSASASGSGASGSGSSGRSESNSRSESRGESGSRSESRGESGGRSESNGKSEGSGEGGGGKSGKH